MTRASGVAELGELVDGGGEAGTQRRTHVDVLARSRDPVGLLEERWKRRVLLARRVPGAIQCDSARRFDKILRRAEGAGVLLAIERGSQSDERYGDRSTLGFVHPRLQQVGERRTERDVGRRLSCHAAHPIGLFASVSCDAEVPHSLNIVLRPHGARGHRPWIASMRRAVIDVVLVNQLARPAHYRVVVLVTDEPGSQCQRLQLVTRGDVPERTLSGVIVEQEEEVERIGHVGIVA